MSFLTPSSPEVADEMMSSSLKKSGGWGGGGRTNKTPSVLRKATPYRLRVGGIHHRKLASMGGRALVVPMERPAYTFKESQPECAPVPPWVPRRRAVPTSGTKAPSQPVAAWASPAGARLPPPALGRPPPDGTQHSHRACPSSPGHFGLRKSPLWPKLEVCIQPSMNRPLEKKTDLTMQVRGQLCHSPGRYEIRPPSSPT